MKGASVGGWLLAGCVALVLALSGCEEVSEPAQKAGEEIDKVMGQVNEGLKELID